jgi:membrane protein involved in colicin uptake
MEFRVTAEAEAKVKLAAETEAKAKADEEAKKQAEAKKIADDAAKAKADQDAKDKAAANAAAKAAAAEAKKKEANKTITNAEFDQLKTGMTYDEATDIIGGPGEVLSESGTKGGSGLDIHTVMYMYKGEGSLGANANLMFQNEKLINKAQLGLK